MTKQALSVLVCGGRDFNDREQVFHVLNDLASKRGIREIIHGVARGADTLADEWGRAAGVYVEKYPALWDEHGRQAGPIRNQLMLDDGKPDIVIAFPGGRGTADMVRRARAAGVEVVEIPDLSEFW